MLVSQFHDLLHDHKISHFDLYCVGSIMGHVSYLEREKNSCLHGEQGQDGLGRKGCWRKD